MTDKEQIIIDGVDVSECKHYERHSFYDCNETCEDNGAIVCTNCEDNPDCYFKQLARKEQEINNVQEYYKELRSNVTELANKYVQLRRQLKEKEQECEELKAESFTREELITIQEKDIDHYRRAFEEIDKIINNIFDRCLGHKTDGCTPVHNVCEELIKILDIINKAKGEKYGDTDEQ